MNEDKEPKQVSLEGFIDEGKAIIVPDADEERNDFQAPVSAYTNRPQFDIEDVAPPLLRLMQGLSPEVTEGAAKPGQWVLAGFDAADELTIVPLAYARRREYRDPDSGLMSCTSMDGEFGNGQPGGRCADCEMNKWTGEGKNRRGPQCVFMYSYMVYVKEFDTGGILNFKRTSLAVGRSLNSLVSRSGMGNVVVTLGSKVQKGGKGTYHIPQLVPVNDSTADGVLEKANPFLLQ